MAKSEEELEKRLYEALDNLIDWMLGHSEEELHSIDFYKAKREVWYAIEAHAATVAAEAAREAVALELKYWIERQSTLGMAIRGSQFRERLDALNTTQAEEGYSPRYDLSGD